MKSYSFTVRLLALSSVLEHAAAFSAASYGFDSNGFVLSSRRSQYAALNSPITVLRAAVELEPEPEGGDELRAVKTMAGSRMKNMGEASGVKSDSGSTVYTFWLNAKAEGALLKSIHASVLKDAAKKANFPGFRKGQVPPYAMPQIRGFSVQEGIIQTCQSAVEAYGLKSLPGSAGEVQVLEDIPAVANSYKLGDDVVFTATFKAIYDPALQTPVEGGVIDVGSSVITDPAGGQ